MVTINWTPDDQLLRRFGWIGLVGFPLIGWLVFSLVPESESMGIWVVFGSLAVACGLLAALAPHRLKPIYLLVMSLISVISYPITIIVRVLGGSRRDDSGDGDFGGNAGNLPDDGPPEESEN